LKCTACGHEPTFGLSSDRQDACTRCGSALKAKISSNEINGNFDYLGEITDAVVRKNLKAETKLAKHVDRTVVSYLNGIKKLSKYETINLEDQIYSNVRGIEKKPLCKHYRAIVALKKEVRLEKWANNIAREEEHMRLMELKAADQLSIGSD
jgi:hypothetical protein